MWFVTSLLTYIFFEILSIVSSNGTFVKNVSTSNDTILYPSGTFYFWTNLANSLVLLIVNSDLLNGANNLAKYFAVSYVMVPISDTIFLDVKLSTLLVESVLLQSHRNYQGNIMLGSAFYKIFLAVSIYDPIIKFESKVQRTLMNVKLQLTEFFYKKLYSTGSYPVKFYGISKVHKLWTNKVDNLTLIPIASDMSTVTYETAKHLARLLVPLNKSEFTINNTKEFVKYIQK